MKLNDAAALYFGSQPIVKAYMGEIQVWPQEEPAGIIDEANLLDQWLAEDAAIFGEGQLVSAWTGRVNGIVASQALDVRKPRYFGGVGGQPGLLFAGNHLNTPYIDTLRNITVYAKVYFSSAPTVTSTIACQDTGGNNRSWHFGVNPTSNGRFVNFNAGGASGSAIAHNGAVPLSTWFVAGARRALMPDLSILATAHYNGNTSAPLTVATTNMQESLYVSIGSRGSTAEAMNGYIGELRIYKSVHDDATRALVRQQMGFG